MSETTPTSLLVAEIPYLRAFAISLSGSLNSADDLVQETLVKAWTKFDSFEPGTNLRAWLITILRNTFYSIHRKYRREVQDTEGTHAAQVAVRGAQDSHLEMADFQRALDLLAPEHREVLVMIGVTELSYEEAAVVCGVAVGTIKSRAHRARVKLAEIMGLSSTGDIGPDPVSSGILSRPAAKFISG